MERELLLLGLLRQEGRHGYELYDFIERTLQTCVDLKRSTAYYLLDKLAKGGYIEEREEQVGNRPPRRVYRLTPAGETYYQQLLRDNLAGHRPPPFPDTIGLAFLDDMPVTEAHALLSRRRAAIAAELEGLRVVPAHPGSLQLVIDHQTAYIAAELNWLDDVIRRLSEQEEETSHGN